jgi:hypothetical protein
MLDGKTEVTENSDETDEEEDDVTQQTPVLLLPKSVQTRLTKGSVRQGYPWQSRDDSYDDQLISIPSALHRVSKLGQLTVGSNSNIHQSTHDMTGKRHKVAHHTAIR